LLQELLDSLHELPPVSVYLVIAILAAVENIFPPVPADTAVALGAFLSRGGLVSAPVVFLITWACNVTSATAVYAAGRTVGRSFFTGRVGRRLLHPERLRQLEHLYHRHGTWGLFLSRFIPAVRAVVPSFAGVTRLSWPRYLAAVTVASGIWYGTLTYVAATLLQRLDDIGRLLGQINLIATGAALLAAGLLVLWYFLLHRRRAR
jgi:membrane protein DedA with SNARE-associated domain